MRRVLREAGAVGRELRSSVFGFTAIGMFVIWLSLAVCGASVTAATIAFVVVVGGTGIAMLTLPLWASSRRRPRHAGR